MHTQHRDDRDEDSTRLMPARVKCDNITRHGTCFTHTLIGKAVTGMAESTALAAAVEKAETVRGYRLLSEVIGESEVEEDDEDEDEEV